MAVAADLVRRDRLVDGDETRDTLLARFRDSGKAILLGTASFWEGVDVPGDALQALVIAKLPFPVPDDQAFDLGVAREVAAEPRR